MYSFHSPNVMLNLYIDWFCSFRDICDPLVCNQIANIARPWIQAIVSLTSPTVVGIRCAYPRKTVQAKLIWAAGFVLKWFTRPITQNDL